ncbi:NAD(P)/FAD-dependent oxidoreductase [Chondromyces crocatus]|uniref:Monooxygenase n=1 Tax=Chondromyces crocatus TaxID=52 RepID=A0A0K1ECS5_CHOCO|nr:NAD(P)/FAD-dependent oxidoreductase [Chondromyces crocatus]AKT38671.1 monooxygenase [Chondromyces crocatus]
MPNHEVIVVGGGPAGVTAALAFAHQKPALAERIVVLERDHYPRDKYCAGGLGGRADRALARLGVHVDVPSVAIRGMSATTLDGEVSDRAGVIGRVVRRIEFDHALARIARTRGIQVVEGARVTALSFHDEEVVAESTKGAFHGRVVIGADGVGSIVRRALGLPFGRLRAQAVEVDTEPVATDRPRDMLHFDLDDHSYAGYAWDFPTLIDGAPMVCRGVYVLHPGALSRSASDEAFAGGDPDALLRAHLRKRGLDPARYRFKRFAERGLAAGLTMARPRALLVGEAAGIDPLFGEGIAQAIAYGVLAGAYLAPRLDAGALDFTDWDQHIQRSRLGADLRVRRRLVRRFYGRDRVRIERGVAASPSLLRFGLHHFSGDRMPMNEGMRAFVAALSLYARLRLPVP